MSTIHQLTPTASGVFQAHYGTPPGSHDAKVDCEKWQRLCDELLAERERLRAQLERAQLDAFCKDFKPTLTMDEVYAQVDRTTSLDEMIAEMKLELETEK